MRDLRGRLRRLERKRAEAVPEGPRVNWANLVVKRKEDLVPDGVFWPNSFPNYEDRPDTIEKRIEQILRDGGATRGKASEEGFPAAPAGG